MSYRMPISARSRKAGRFIARVHSEIQRAFTASGMKQNALAEKLGVNRSHVNKQLLGQTNLTLRTIADLAWAMDKEIHFSLGGPLVSVRLNYFENDNEVETDDGLDIIGTESKPSSTGDVLGCLEHA